MVENPEEEHGGAWIAILEDLSSFFTFESQQEIKQVKKKELPG